ncbi:MAG: hypothetical protein DBX56_06985, partial [Coriobacteriia bacterium]
DTSIVGLIRGYACRRGFQLFYVLLISSYEGDLEKRQSSVLFRKSDYWRACFIKTSLPAVHAMVVSRRHTVVVFALENVPFERGVSL